MSMISCYSGLDGKQLEADIERGVSADQLICRSPGYLDLTLLATEVDGSELAMVPDRPFIGLCELAIERSTPLRVLSTSTAAVSVRCYRHGYEKKLIANLKLEDAAQIDKAGVMSGLPTMIETADFEPGLYSIEVLDGSQQLQSQPFVVEPIADELHRYELVVILNTNTWQCYNFFGGRSRYRRGPVTSGASASDRRSAVAARLSEAITKFDEPLARRRHPWIYEPLPGRRPLDSVGLRSSAPTDPYLDHLAGHEWRVLAWLERLGIPHTTLADRSIGHRHPMLDGSPAVMLAGHSEYWHVEGIRTIAEAHLERGVSLVNLSGNAMYATVELLDDGGVRCTRRRIGRRMEGLAPRRLLGSRTNLRNVNTNAPFQVTDRSHPLWGGRPGPIVGSESLLRNSASTTHQVNGCLPGNGFALLVGRGASGWEVDECLDRSRDLLAVGSNPGGGAPIMFRERSGTTGSAFSIPSIALASSLLVDEALSGLAERAIAEALG